MLHAVTLVPVVQCSTQSSPTTYLWCGAQAIAVFNYGFDVVHYCAVVWHKYLCKRAYIFFVSLYLSVSKITLLKMNLREILVRRYAVDKKQLTRSDLHPALIILSRLVNLHVSCAIYSLLNSTGALKMQDKTLQDRTMTDKLAGPDFAGQDSDGQTSMA